MFKIHLGNITNKAFIPRRRSGLLILGGLAAALVVFQALPPSASSGKPPRHSPGMAMVNDVGHDETRTIKYWTCSMHPQIKLPKKGLCPICGMELIPVYERGGENTVGTDVSLTLNEVGQKLAEVETTLVRYENVSHEVRLVGKVDYDETRLSYISAWVPGRIDRLFVDFTGTKVRKGDHLIQLYSPELLAAQQEYLQAIKNLADTQNSQLSVFRDTARNTVKSAREKLRLYGIKEEQIGALEQRGTPDEHMTVYSPLAGTVIHKNGFEGMYVKTGDKIYTIADLNKVWLFLNAYESDIPWLHYGQDVKIEAESYPGEIFHGKIAFVEPFVDETTRTIKLRINVVNKGEKLKPGMFVRAAIQAVMGEDGNIYEEDLAGKWICPMHPDVVKENPGACDICGMDLIPTSEFGFSQHGLARKKVLVIPATAPLLTGKRAVVYVENETEKATTKRYEGREVVLGPRAGDTYVVFSGLKEGERVVTKGNFKIDSALEIQAKPSMMNPAGYYTESDHVFSPGAEAVTENAGILSAAVPYYLAAAQALAGDNPQAASDELDKFKSEIEKLTVKHSLNEQPAGMARDILSLREKLQSIGDTLDVLRVQFGGISAALKDILAEHEYKEDLKLYLAFCPMAFNNEGGYWLQDSKEIKNPYFGSKMLSCGEIKAEYGRTIQDAKPTEGHAGHHM